MQTFGLEVGQEELHGRGDDPFAQQVDHQVDDVLGDILTGQGCE
jgi:hypothetical protein